ncbi:hypothetical protein VNI00_016672 [Paramarasmius palmivorus]|uniref:Uncharacterized protein n=1 Tax=Paramarasmius palmivorus TaxID=297713 RepID=A0AAW0BD71_9AGAR
MNSPAYTSQYLKNVPSAISFVLESTAPYLTALTLRISQHPDIIRSFRITTFPRLRTLEANHYLLLSPLVIAALHERLVNAVLERNATSRNSSLPLFPYSNVIVNPWPCLSILIILCNVVIPDYADHPFDYRHISQTVDVCVELDWGFDWELNVDKFLSHVKLPINCRVVAMVAMLDEYTLNSWRKLRWHPKSIVVPYKTTDMVSVHRESLTSDLRLLVIDGCHEEVASGEIWDKAREVVQNRSLPDNVFHLDYDCSFIKVL